MRIPSAAIALLCFSNASLAGESDGCERLFALRRSSNRNEVIYESCPNRSVRAFWWMLERGGSREDLTALEERFAYGVSLQPDTDGAVRFSLRAAPARAMMVRKTSDGPRAIVRIRGMECALLDVYVSVTDGLLPSVRYVELGGIALATGALVSERIEPRG
jgi:hypothetical protein